MEYCIIIRGPAGVGKTTIAKELARNLDADYFSFDEIMEENKLDTIVGDGIPSKNSETMYLPTVLLVLFIEQNPHGLPSEK